MKTKFTWYTVDWKRIKNHCRTTDNKDFTDKEPTEQFKKNLLISEHSPIRLIEFDWRWEGMPSWVSVHWVRHKWEKFVSTQRDDRKDHDIPRGKMPQDTPVNFDGYANMQSLIDSFRKRLCFQASPETREYAEDFKIALHEIFPELADVCVPNCIYRCGCPEKFQNTCRFFRNFTSSFVIHRNLDEIFDIQTRYDIYNKFFYDLRHVER